MILNNKYLDYVWVYLMHLIKKLKLNREIYFGKIKMKVSYVNLELTSLHLNLFKLYENLTNICKLYFLRTALIQSTQICCQK